MTFEDRKDAGERLAEEILRRELVRRDTSTLVLAIPRGGVVVANEVARKLHAPLDVWLSRKIGAPGNREYAIGSVSVNGETFLSEGLGPDDLREEIAYQKSELSRQMVLFRGHDEPVDVKGKTVILVDDGVATGATAFAALASLKRAGAATRILAVPVAPFDTAPKLRAACEEAIILDAPHVFYAVGQFYRNFNQVSDEEVINILGSHSGKTVL